MACLRGMRAIALSGLYLRPGKDDVSNGTGRKWSADVMENSQ